MFPAAIAAYEAPTSVAAALEALSAHEDAMFIAGGMSLMQAIKARLVRPRCLVDLQRVAELKGLSSEAGGIRIGAMTRYRDIAGSSLLRGAYEALVDATSHVGDRQVRNRGTIGGSLCWNYIAACTPVAAIAAGATIELQSKARGRRMLPVEDFLVSPMETQREGDEIALAVRLAAPAPRTGSAYRKWGLVTDALPVVGVGVLVSLDAEGRCASARVGLGGLGGGSQRNAIAEQGLLGLRVSDRRAIEAAFAGAAAAADVQADLWADQDFRRTLIRELGIEVALAAFARASGQAA
jgi:carbon-monoxide dehydrogenase medium subunit